MCEIIERNRREAAAEALAKGRAEGKAEGELKAKLADALEMLKDNMPWERIHKYTSLSVPQIEQLARENALA